MAKDDITRTPPYHLPPQEPDPPSELIDTDPERENPRSHWATKADLDDVREELLERIGSVDAQQTEMLGLLRSAVETNERQDKGLDSVRGKLTWMAAGGAFVTGLVEFAKALWLG